jgi:Flp pilus assembly protein TadD
MATRLPVLGLLIGLALAGCSEQERRYAEAVERSRQGDFPAAIAIYRDIVRSDPENPRFLNNLGWALFRDGDVDEGLSSLLDAQNRSADGSLSRMIQTNLDMVRTFQSGKKHMENADFEAALSDFERLLDTYGATEIAVQHKALCLEKLDRQSEAKTLWQSLLSMYKDRSFRSHYADLARKKLGI